MLMKNLCGFKPVLYILASAVIANDTTERIITDKETSLEIKQETVSTVEQQKAFRMFGGSLETISRDRLLDSFLEIVKSDEQFYVMTILNFNPVDYIELGDYLGNLSAILALHGENNAWYNYLDNFGLEMVCITKPLDDKALILNEKFEDLEKIYNKLHTLVLDKFPEIAYDTIRGELIMQLQKAMTKGLAGQTKIAEQSHDELVAESQSKVAELIESAQNYSAPDRLIEETLWHHCNKYEDPYYIETDIEDFEHSIKYEQIVDVIRVKKFFLHLACNKYKEDLKKCITNMVSKFLPIIQKEENIKMFVSYYISVKQFIIQKLGYKDMPNLIHRIEKLVDKSIMHYQISKLENKLRRYFNEMLPTLQAEFGARKEELLKNQLIKNITRIFSCDETFLDIDQVQLSRILMTDNTLNENDTIGDKEDEIDEDEMQPMLEGETEEKSKPCTIYGIRYIVIPSMSEASTPEKQQDNERAELESRK